MKAWNQITHYAGFDWAKDHHDVIVVDGSGKIRRLRVSQIQRCIVIAAQGYSARDRCAPGIAAARHLLELVYRRPVMVKRLVLNRGRG